MPQRLFAAVVLILSVLLSPLAALAQEPAAADASAAEKESLARELLAVSGAGDLGVQMMEQMSVALRPTAPDVSDEIWDQIFGEVDAEELVELVVPIYVEHLTVEEMQAAIDFYRTPEGQSLVEKMPVISQESFAVGQQWGMELAQRVMEEVEAAQEDSGDGER